MMLKWLDARRHENKHCQRFKEMFVEMGPKEQELKKGPTAAESAGLF